MSESESKASTKKKVNYSIRKLPGFGETSESIIETLIEVNSAAFEGDKFINLLVGGHPELAPILHRAFTADFLRGGCVYVVEVADSDGSGTGGVKIVGDAMWVGPGVGGSLLKNDSESEAEGRGTGTGKEKGESQGGFNHFMEALEKTDPSAARWWKDYYFENYASFTSACLSGPSSKKEDGWRLQVIGILPEYQGCGIGRALIRVVEDEILRNRPESGVEAMGRPGRMSLETESESAREFYRKIGFVELGETEIEGVGDLGKCTMWCLAKEV